MHACSDLSILQQIICETSPCKHLRGTSTTCEMQENQKPRLKPYVKENAYLMVTCNEKDFSARAPRPT